MLTLVLITVVSVTVLLVLFELVEARPCDHDLLPPNARISTDDLPKLLGHVQIRSRPHVCHRHRSRTANSDYRSRLGERQPMLEIIRSVSQN